MQESKKKTRDELLYTKIHTTHFLVRSGFEISSKTQKLAFTHTSVSSWRFETSQPHRRWALIFQNNQQGVRDEEGQDQHPEVIFYTWRVGHFVVIS
jgi:hypothetical protein